MPKENKPDTDAEERRKYRAKCRFRALGRMVIANMHWLAEAVEEYEGLDNVKRRVEQAVRGKSKNKQLLNIHDKALLNKPACERTEQEKKYIYRIIGGLKCFRRYPDHVKRKLAAVTYFKYYGPDRVIVRQNQEAHALYFIVTGDVIISVLIYDELLQKSMTIAVGQMHAGDMFGEVSLLHNIKRTATCTASGHCEFLALMKEDFKNVLQASLQKQWDEIHQAMSSFSYFNAYDPVALREGCIVAKMKSFNPNDTILGDGRGTSNYVYFVLSGRCQMIETLQVNVTINVMGKEIYSLYDPFVRVSEGEIDFDKKYFDVKAEATNAQAADEESSKKLTISEDGSEDKAGSKLKSSISTSKFTEETEENVDISRNTMPNTLTSRVTSLKSSNVQGHSQDKKSLKYDNEAIDVERNLQPQLNRRTYFMQVCEFLPGATFGFGENMRDRRIVAQTRVDCMLMPYIWLMQRNTVNIWSRIKHYLDRKIPTKQKLFEEFVKQRRWCSYREDLVDGVVRKKDRVNATSIFDVPFTIRLEELVDT